MSFPTVYEAIVDMIRDIVLQVTNARGIMRKSGFRMGSSVTEALSERAILTTPPCSPAQGCPRLPLGEPAASMTEEERADFYDMVTRGEAAEPAAFVEMRQWLIDHGYEDQIVIDGILPILGYDYAGEVYTLEITDGAACPIEVDCAPPADGFWEEYKGDDTRFSSTGVFVNADQDVKVLMKSYFFKTAGISSVSEEVDVGHGFPTCPSVTVPGEVITHNIWSIKAEAPNTFAASTIVGYVGEFGNDPILSWQVPLPIITSDRMLASAAAPVFEETGFSSGPYEWVASTDIPFDGATEAKWIKRQDPNVLHVADSEFLPCDATEPTFDYTQEYFCRLRPSGAIPNADLTDTTTWAELRGVGKSDTFSRQLIDWTINPASPGELVPRFSWEWPTFDVVAVRMTGDGPTLGAGSHLIP